MRDLVDAAIVTTRAKLRRQMRADIAAAVEERILDSLIGTDGPSTTRVSPRIMLVWCSCTLGVTEVRR